MNRPHPTTRPSRTTKPPTASASSSSWNGPADDHPTRRRTLRARLLDFIRGATSRLTSAWRILTDAQNRLLTALAAIRPGRAATTRIRAAVLAFQQALASFDRAAGGFIERWAATDLPLAYRDGSLAMLDQADRPHRSWSWTTRHQNTVTTVTAQFYADLMGRLREAIRRAQAFLRAATDAARTRITQFDVGSFDADALRQQHPSAR
ncbi:hypothetical protein [Streptomyces microflavus]|uniref:hypothetical protein n=1 Tax=Streptomyces microflavus TaxID=1919 RepID=UPI003B21E2E0